MKARENEANKLLEAGYGDYLIIPAHGRIYRKTAQQSLSVNNYYIMGNNLGPVGDYPRFYEDTHIEVLEAKRIMDHFRLRKANFVSSPYHLRRIKLISDRVFHLKNSGTITYQIKFVPALIKSSWAEMLPWDLTYMKSITSEYTKIAYFCLYNFLTITFSKEMEAGL